MFLIKVLIRNTNGVRKTWYVMETIIWSVGYSQAGQRVLSQKLFLWSRLALMINTGMLYLGSMRCQWGRLRLWWAHFPAVEEAGSVQSFYLSCWIIKYWKCSRRKIADHSFNGTNCKQKVYCSTSSTGNTWQSPRLHSDGLIITRLVMDSCMKNKWFSS